MGVHPPCVIGSKANSSPTFSLVSKPSSEFISRPETIINALECGFQCFSVENKLLQLVKVRSSG